MSVPMTLTAPPASMDGGQSTGSPTQGERWLGCDEHGVDLTLLQAMLDLAPIDRLRRMERHARDVQALMMYGKRHRAAETS